MGLKTAELAALPDALWLRHKMSIVPGSWEVIEKDDFLAAIKEAMQAQKKRDAEIMREAAEDVAEWGVYAGEYFQKKWDLAGCIRKWEERAAAIERD